VQFRNSFRKELIKGERGAIGGKYKYSNVLNIRKNFRRKKLICYVSTCKTYHTLSTASNQYNISSGINNYEIVEKTPQYQLEDNH
jgi:hypothetical protein